MRYPVFSALDKTLETNGIKLVFLMRMSLLVPFNISNFIFGATAIPFTHYMVGTIGVLPIQIFYVYLGTTMSNIEAAISGKEPLTTVQIIVMVVGSLFAIAGIIYVTCVVKKNLREAAE